MTLLWPHQLEIAALARRQSAVMSCPNPVGKTFLACCLLRDAVAPDASVSPSAPASLAASHRQDRQLAIAVAPTPTERAAIEQELSRLCSFPIVSCDGELETTKLWLQDDAFARAQLEQHATQIAVLSPKITLELVRKQIIPLAALELLVVEAFDQVHAELPSFFPTLFQHLEMDCDHRRPELSASSATALRIFATTRLPCSKLHWREGENPLFGRVQVLNLVPLLASQAPAPTFPPLQCEPFVASTPIEVAPLDVKDFLLGNNSKHVDLVGVYRRELELGNSKATIDGKTKQERVNRFIADAVAVYEHLGMWCLWKFVEIELQASLLACVVHDSDQASSSTRTERGASMDGSSDMEIDIEPEEGEVQESDAEAGAQVADEDKLLIKVLGSDVQIDADSRAAIRPIAKVIAWIGAQARKCGVQSASPRLLKTADVVRARFQNRRSSDGRAWVFVIRRCHCRVVAEYLWAAVTDLDLPPPCSMLGSSGARVCGSPHFSSYLKVMQMFHKRSTRILVTTSMKKTSQDQRIEPPLCDLVVIMDELLEPNKLFDLASRADPVTGIVVYLTHDTPADLKKFEVLKAKMQESLIQHEVPAHAPTRAAAATSAAAFKSPVVPSRSATTLAQVVSLSTSQTTLAPARSMPLTPNASSGVSFPPHRQTFPSQKPYELRYDDTGAVLDVTNSVTCLSEFCDTLPGLDTYDRHPEYRVKRISTAVGMKASIKRYKKKKLKYNSKLNDKIDDLKIDAETAVNEGGAEDEIESDGRFHYSATLRLPNCLGIKKLLVSPTVETEAEAKGICAFQACQEMIKKGLLDRNFRSRLIDDEASIIHRTPAVATKPAKPIAPISSEDEAKPVITSNLVNDSDPRGQLAQLKDMSTQDSYDLPPVSATELSLRPIRSLLTGDVSEVSADGVDSWSTTMCFYALTGVRFAILATNELYTGNTNTGWRYDFAMCHIMDGTLSSLTLQKHPTKMTLTKKELQDVLHFHLVTMRLACMTVADALRDIDIVGENVWSEFSEQNDKGYLVVPSVFDEATQSHSLDWTYLRDIIRLPLLQPMWPLPSSEEVASDEWVCVPETRRNVTYVIHSVTDEKIPDVRKKYLSDDEAWLAHLKKGKSTPGNPILGRWHTREQLESADDDQPMLYAIQVPQIVPIIRRVMQRNLEESSIAKLPTKFNERLLVPQYMQRLRLTKSRYFEAMGIVPVLYEFERKCQISNLMTRIGLEVDMTLLDDATTKPAYERYEILGDTFLKLETSWFMFENRKDIVQEGHLTQLRRDIIRNDRLNQFAICARLHHYILYPAEVEQHPFKCWKPSCMGKTPDPVVAPSKWVADVLEAVCGAYLIGQGEKGARHFLRWVGVTVLEDPITFVRPFYPDCFPNELYDDGMESMNARTTRPLSMNFSIPQFEDMPRRLVLLQKRLKYTFRNKRLLLEAVTHPSIGQLVLHMDELDNAGRNGVASGEGDIELPTVGSASKKQKKKKNVWKGDYERLEYLGDALIEYLTLSYAFLTYDKWQPGSLSQWKSATVSNDALGKTALSWFGVDECICAGSVQMDSETMERVTKVARMYKQTDTSVSSSLSASLGSAARGPSKSRVPRRGVGGTHGNNHTLPKMFADVFEALVAAVFLDSGRDLQQVRDVFMFPLLETVGKDAFAYVCHESGLAVDNLGEEFMDELSLSSDDE